jgi:hypothetical protein
MFYFLVFVAVFAVGFDCLFLLSFYLQPCACVCIFYFPIQCAFTQCAVYALDTVQSSSSSLLKRDWFFFKIINRAMQTEESLTYQWNRETNDWNP